MPNHHSVKHKGSDPFRPKGVRPPMAFVTANARKTLYFTQIECSNGPKTPSVKQKGSDPFLPDGVRPHRLTGRRGNAAGPRANTNDQLAHIKPTDRLAHITTTDPARPSDAENSAC